MKWISLLLCLMFLSSIVSAQDPATYFDSLGSKLLSKGNYSQALDLFNKSLDQKKESAAAWTHKGNALRSLRQYNASIESLNHALKIDESYAPALVGLSDTYLAQKNYMAAYVAATQLTSLNPKDKTCWLREGKLLQMMGMFDQSLPKLDQAIAMDPKYKEALYRKGLFFMGTGQYSVAIDQFNSILTLDPKYKQAYNARGLAYAAEGDHDRALSSYERALVLDPKFAQAKNNKMHSLLALKRQSEAIDIFTTI